MSPEAGRPPELGSDGGVDPPEDGLVPIGELARRTGVAPSALRYYERIGLLSPTGRAGRRRCYHGARNASR